MSKINAMRALREARYAERNGPGARPSTRQAATRFPLSTDDKGGERAGATVGEKAGEKAGDKARAKASDKPSSEPTPTATPAAASVPADSAAASVPDVAEELCGHRNMGGRTCTREAGHAAKSHRYS